MTAALTAAVALVALVLAMVAIVIATIANRRWSRRRRTRTAGPGGNLVGDQVDALSQVLGELHVATSQLQDRVTDLELRAAQAQATRGAAATDRSALRHVAMVRYDAFADVGGRLSYTVAILDDTVSGLVITSLAGKADVRTYVRVISAGAADGSLTAEEQQAIDAAVGSEQ